jgi:hypothetical protein
VSGAPAQRAYEYRNSWLQTHESPQNVNTVLRFSSSRDQGLGDALPAGTVRVYQRDARGNPQFVGESRIDHTPMGSQLGLTTGQAFDVKVQPVVAERRKISVEEWRTTSRFRIFNPDGSVTQGEGDSLRQTDYWQTRMRYTLTNARPVPVTVTVTQDGLWPWYWSDTRIVSETIRSERPAADRVVWQVPVPANGTVNLDVVFQTRH